MLNDHVRNKAFHLALEAVITNSSRVLDIGAGTGLLSMMSSRLGAKHVLGIEKNTILNKLGHEILELNGFNEDQIQLYSGQSYAVKVGSKYLPEPANVLVSETLDSWVIEEGFLVALHDARLRGLISKDAVIIPNRATLYCQLVETRYSLTAMPAMVEGFNLEPLRTHRRKDHNFVVELTPDIVLRNLSAPMAVFDFAFQDMDLSTALFNYSLLSIPITASGNFHAIGFWFDCALDAAG
jgi:predicted RNA methylase